MWTCFFVSNVCKLYFNICSDATAHFSELDCLKLFANNVMGLGHFRTFKLEALMVGNRNEKQILYIESVIDENYVPVRVSVDPALHE